MKNGWILYILGFVRIRIQGHRMEIFLNEAVRKKINIWEVKRINNEILECNIKLADIWRLKRIRRKTESSFQFVEKNGLPFQMRRMLLNKGFILGLISCIVLIFILSNMVFGIRINGASPATEELVVKELEKLGVKKGAFIFQLDDPETIQKKLTNNITEITWVGVQLKGTTYQFRVVEKEEPTKVKVLLPQHIVATKDAVITKIYSENGKAAVKVNQLVKKGQLLISGFIGKEEDKKQIPIAAEGVVLGETWYESDVAVPMKSKFKLLTGNSQKKYYLDFGLFQLKIWGFEKTKYNLTEINEVKKSFHSKLPISLNIREIFEENELERQYTLNEAIEVGKEIAEKELKKKLPKDAMIKEVKILRQTVSGGNLKLKLYFVVEESITVAKPIR